MINNIDENMKNGNKNVYEVAHGPVLDERYNSRKEIVFILPI